ncbi:MAG: hypothetical protein M1832_005196 [Thelocarpon impressellum]|nr:MAG: hypothetical protein M1832_005196 [Thelocarpon impressellum]
MASVPDPWDDDWESQADKQDNSVSADASGKSSKAERLAKHAALNKKLWESAESTESFPFIQTKDEVPLKTEFKPAVKVLSRKPESNLAQSSLDDDEDEDATKKQALSPEELRQKAQREREEKQRRYDEVRERLFGGTSGTSSPGNVTPPKANIGGPGEGKAGRGKGKGRGGRDNRASTESSEARSRKNNIGVAGDIKKLYDPNYAIKQDSVYIQKQEGESSRLATPSEDASQKPIRAPKGPDPSGRGGHGFAPRGRSGS